VILSVFEKPSSIFAWKKLQNKLVLKKKSCKIGSNMCGKNEKTASRENDCI
jgi:hypothetical protein